MKAKRHAVMEGNGREANMVQVDHPLKGLSFSSEGVPNIWGQFFEKKNRGIIKFIITKMWGVTR